MNRCYLEPNEILPRKKVRIGLVKYRRMMKSYIYVKVKNDSRGVLIFSYYGTNVVRLVAVTNSMTRKHPENISA